MAYKACVRRLAWGAMVVSLAIVSRASADPSPAAQAAAEALFREAKQFMSEGRFAEACPKLLESQRLDPAPGTGLNLGDCYEKNGQTASAWGAFNDTAVIARRLNDKTREPEAIRRAKALEDKLSKLLVSVPAGANVPGIEVRRDGQPLGTGLWGSAIPVDPGAHTVEAVAPDRARWSTTVTVPSDPGLTTVTVPALALKPAEPTAASPSEATGWSTQRTIALAVGGAGLIGIVVGSVFGVQAGNKLSDSKAHCRPNEPNICTQEGVQARSDGATAADVSTAAFIASGMALAGGVVLFVTAPSGKGAEKNTSARRLQVRPMPAAAGLSFEGAW